jgi:hypothetical protein
MGFQGQLLKPAIGQLMTGNPNTRAFAVFVIGLSAFFLSGCPPENVGGIQKSSEITQAFEALHVFPNYHYYFLNQEDDPYGVAGLERGYWMEGPSWKEIDPTSPAFKKAVGLVQSFPVPGGRSEGFYIVDHHGTSIGVWYSSLGAGITVDPDSKRVSITTKTPWLSQ